MIEAMPLWPPLLPCSRRRDTPAVEMDVVEHRDAAFGRNAVASGEAPQLTARVVDMDMQLREMERRPLPRGDGGQAVLAGHPGRTKTLCEQIHCPLADIVRCLGILRLRIAQSHHQMPSGVVCHRLNGAHWMTQTSGRPSPRGCQFSNDEVELIGFGSLQEHQIAGLEEIAQEPQRRS